jgi:addiction module HigA family antidote
VSEEERQARVWAAYGSMAHVRMSVDDFLREKREDAEREMEGTTSMRDYVPLRPDEVFEHGRLPNIHVGEILREEFLEPLSLSAEQLAEGVGIAPALVEEILASARPVTVEVALRLERFFGVSAEFWLNLQTACELEEARRELAAELSAIRPYPRAAA